MNKFITTITDWPIIIQGALGSFLFWGFYITGSYVVKKLTGRLSKHNTQQKIDKMRLKGARLAYRHHKKTEEKIFWLLLPVQYAFGKIIKALLFTFMGVVLGYFIDVFYVIGGAVGLYYLFLANNAFVSTKHIDDENILDEVNRLSAEINNLEEST